jgi:hypothetical protein
MIDRYEYIHKRNILYGVYVGDFSDTIKVNQNRRSIGLKVKFQVISINTLVKFRYKLNIWLLWFIQKTALCDFTSSNNPLKRLKK